MCPRSLCLRRWEGNDDVWGQFYNLMTEVGAATHARHAIRCRLCSRSLNFLPFTPFTSRITRTTTRITTITTITAMRMRTTIRTTTTTKTGTRSVWGRGAGREGRPPWPPWGPACTSGPGHAGLLTQQLPVSLHACRRSRGMHDAWSFSPSVGDLRRLPSSSWERFVAGGAAGAPAQ